MAKNEPEFTVTDRRKFTIDGEARPEDQAPQQQPQAASVETPATPEERTMAPETDIPLPPSASEQQEQADAYRNTSQKLDEQLDAELKRHGETRRAQDFEITFEKFVAS